MSYAACAACSGPKIHRRHSAGRAQEVPLIRDEHIETETLAALADGRVDDAVAEELSAHLAGCRSCMAAYVDAVRYRCAWLATPGAFEPTPATLRQGRSVVAASLAARRRPALSWRLAPALAAFALAVGFVAWRWQPAGSPPLRAALERESSRGLVLPGGERGADRETPVLRGPADAAFETALSRVVRRYEAGERSARTVYEVAAGFLLTGNLEAARGYIDEGLRNHPGDRRLGILAAVLHYRSSELERAEGALRQVLRRSPDDGLAMLDLAIMVAERGARDEARALLETLIARNPGSPLARRAGKVLGRLRRP